MQLWKANELIVSNIQIKLMRMSVWQIWSGGDTVIVRLVQGKAAVYYNYHKRNKRYYMAR